jgi:hypothetical protein
MKVNIGKVVMSVIIVLVALLLFALPALPAPLVNPVLDHLDSQNVSYIAKVEKSTLVIYLVRGSVDLDKLGDLANAYDIRVEVRDLQR